MKRRFIVLAAIFLLATATGLAIGLQGSRSPQAATLEVGLDPTPESPSVAWEGVINEIAGTPGEWIVDGLPFAVVDQTQIITGGLVAEPGTWARVEVSKLPSGPQATTVMLQENPAAELFDRVDAMDGGSIWRVGDTQVLIGPGTHIIGTGHVGALALVHGLSSNEGLQAQLIEILPAEEEVDFEGELVSMNGYGWQVDDIFVRLESSTIVHGDPQIGRRVQVRGVEEEPTLVRALSVWVKQPDELQLYGWLVGIGGEGFPYRWQVNLVGGPTIQGAYVSVDSETLVDDRAAPTDHGAWLSIEAVRESDTFYRAQRITVLALAPKLPLVGLVEALPSNGGLQGQWRVAGRQVLVDESTGIVGSPQLGSMVWLVGRVDYGNVLHAELVELMGN